MLCYEIKMLSFAYPDCQNNAVESLCLNITPGEFIALCGCSGSGKTTLLRLLKPLIAPYGEKKGEILFEESDISLTDERTQAAKIGYVMQNPDNQSVTDTVWHELSFGLESLGLPVNEIRRRVAETASFFNLEPLFHKKISELSGGQKQLVNLASVMTMQPSVLLLDEPTGQLDPVAAADFITAVAKINRELSVTVIMSEHRLDELLPVCTRALILDGGRLLFDCSPREAGGLLKAASHPMLESLPLPVKLTRFTDIDSRHINPLTPGEAHSVLREYSQEHILLPLPPRSHRTPADTYPAVEFSEVHFSYEKNLPETAKGLSFKAYGGELLAITGGNGTGKTTALKLISGILKPQSGKVRIAEKYKSVALLPQNPQSLFTEKTVYAELSDALQGKKLGSDERNERIKDICKSCEITEILYKNPFDLSGGEQQRTALAKLLLLKPSVLLLDEPTKGLDGEFKRVLSGILDSLCKDGVCVICVSHDIEFAADNADRCILFFDGINVSEGTPEEFFPRNMYYTTAACKISAGITDKAVTGDELIKICGGKTPAYLPTVKEERQVSEPVTDETKQQKKLPLWRKLAAGVFASGFFIFGFFIMKNVDLTEIVKNGSGGVNSVSSAPGLYAGLLVCLAALALCISRKRGVNKAAMRATGTTKRTAMAAAMIIAAVPLTVFIGTEFFSGRHYYIISLLIIAETMLPFLLIFEKRKPQAREIVIIAVLTALGVAGRLAFFALPGFKPLMAVVIIAGVAFGAETGFMTGALSMFISNLLFGQGPWTPWQMFAMGIIGFLAGLIFSSGRFTPTRLTLSVFGILSALIIYGGLMNPASVIIYQQYPTKAMFITAFITGLPADIVHGAATAVLLWLFSVPALEKLTRVKTKYGLLT